MLNVKIACVGKMKEKFYKDGCAEYIKRLSRTARVEIAEVADEKAPESLSDAEIEQTKHAEGERLLSRIGNGEYVVALAINGEELSSERFAQRLDKLMSEGKSKLTFVIGGSLGLSADVLQRADMKLSFSRFTFCHQLMRVILLEQIYRATKIIAGEPYHK